MKLLVTFVAALFAYDLFLLATSGRTASLVLALLDATVLAFVYALWRAP